MTQKAFPPIYVGGMTLRDYFAAQALTGLIGTQVAAAMAGVEPEGVLSDRSIAKSAYRVADKMMEVREASDG